ncbi:hypothetical protein D3C85_663050 [compost metagenome]
MAELNEILAELNKLEFLVEDREAAHQCLDDCGILKEIDGQTLSTWGRIMAYGDQRVAAVGFTQGLVVDLPTA